MVIPMNAGMVILLAAVNWNRLNATTVIVSVSPGQICVV